MGIESFGENERAIGQGEDALKEGYHFDNLFDQNEDQSGEKTNLGTGKAIKNDFDMTIDKSVIMSVDGEGKLTSIKEGLSKDAATAKQKKLQEQADALLRQYGSDELGTEPPKGIKTDKESFKKAA